MNSPAAISFSRDQCNKLYPFHFIVNEQLQLISSGPGLEKRLAQDEKCVLGVQIELLRPATEPLSMTLLRQISDEVVLLRLKADKLLLRGTFQPIDNSSYIFLGFPWFSSSEEREHADVRPQELGCLDPSFEYLNLISNHEITVEDTKNILEMNRRHKEELKWLSRTNEKTAVKLSLLIESMHSGVLLENEHREIVLANQMFCDIFSIPLAPAALIGMECSNSAEQSKFLFSDEAGFVARIDAILQDKVKVLGEMLEMKDGKVLSRDFIPIVSASGYEGHLWLYTDITDRVHADRKIERQRKFYETVLNEIPADIAIFTPEHRYLYVNKQAIRDEVMREWIKGKDDFEYCAFRNLPESMAHQRRNVFSEVIEKQQSLSFVDTMQKNGQVLHIQRIMYPYIVEDQVELVIGYAVDITEHMQRKLELQIERERLKVLLEVINDGIIRFDTSGTIDFSNPAFEKIVGKCKPGAAANIADIIAPEHQYEFQQAMAAVKNNRGSQQLIVKLSDHEKYIDLFMTPSFTGNEDILVGRISDITERELREQYLFTLFEKEKELNTLKTRFIRIASHELRTPLSTILSNTEILQMLLVQNGVDTAGRYDKYIRKIIKDVFHMNELLAELIVVGRMVDGSEEYNIALHPLREYVVEIVENYFNPSSDGRVPELTIDNSIGEELFCKRMLKHAIVNVIGNAFKYSSGKAAPRISVFHKADFVVLEVQDFGIGIPEAELQFVFDSFYRCSNATAINGTGIGLMLTDHIVRSHGGLIEIESELGEGTIVRLQLPSGN